MDRTDIPYYETVGKGDNFYRVSLAVIRDVIISEDLFFEAFIESANKIKLPAISDWKEEWAEILEAIPNDIDNYAADKAMIDSILSTGKYAVHHSRRFNEAYQPHYRLIDRITFECKMLPAISSFMSATKEEIQ